VTGWLLIQKKSAGEKLKWLLIGAAIGIVSGFLLDPVTPIVKRVCTVSFVLLSGGISVLVMAGFYWIVDMKGYQRWTKPMVIVGSNSILIYLIFSFGYYYILSGVKFLTVLGAGYFGDLGALVQANLVLLIEVIPCFYLYKKKIFLKI